MFFLINLKLLWLVVLVLKYLLVFLNNFYNFNKNYELNLNFIRIIKIGFDILLCMCKLRGKVNCKIKYIEKNYSK